MGSSTVGSPCLGSGYFHDGKEVAQSYVHPVPPQQEKKRICGLSRLVFWTLFTLLFLILAGAGAGVGVALGLKKNKKYVITQPSSRPMLTTLERVHLHQPT